MGIYETLSRKKYIDHAAPSQLSKVLGTLDLTALGIGSTLGVGVYVIAGEVAKSMAGPAVVLSFLIAAIASVFAGLCYAEFSARVPKAGSAYVYSYVTIGEFIAFVIGWNLILEYSIGSASVVKGMSTYIDSLTGMNRIFEENLPIHISGMAEFPDVFAFSVTMLFSLALAFGARESSLMNNVFTFLNLSVVLFVIIAGSLKADPNNWSIPADKVPPKSGDGGFFPYGWSGVFKGAATCFYGFIGFDCIATAGEEAKNPRKSMPLAIIVSLFVIFLAYFGISTVLTMMLPYYMQNENAPLPYVFRYYGWETAAWAVSIGAIFGLCASLLGSMFPLPRIVYAMASDGLIFKWLGRINARFHTPLYGTLFVGLLTASLAAFLNLSQLVNMMSLGTLIAYSIVAACVLLLRYEVDDEDEKLHVPAPFCYNFHRFLCNSFNLQKPTKLTSLIATCEVTLFCFVSGLFGFELETMKIELGALIWWAWLIVAVTGLFAFLLLVLISRQPVAQRVDSSFSVPLIPWLPGISIVINCYLIMQLDHMTWVRFLVWITIGLIIYFTYGIRNSLERSRHEQKEIFDNKQNQGHLFTNSNQILVPSGQ